MHFSTYEYLLFLPCVVAIYYLTPSRLRWAILFLASAVFVLFAQTSFFLVLLAIIAVNYFSGKAIESAGSKTVRKLLFAGSILANAGVLCAFKYYNVINRGSSFIAGLLGIDDPVPHVEWLLPLGISYYIFQAIGYNIEIYVHHKKAESHLGKFAAYLSFFPKLVAGPIERAHDFLPQLYRKITIEYDHLSNGWRLLLWGFFKKMVIAERLNELITPVFNDFHGHSQAAVIVAVILYPIQLYADFSGYTDIALGSARLMGLKLTQNFDRPLLATSLSDFWRRWHISLSTWVRDYIYTPLSLFISLRVSWGKWGIALALFCSFLILGAWHGSDWKFAIFGGIHGLVLSYELISGKLRRKIAAGLPPWAYNSFSVLTTFAIFSFSCLFFRAATLWEPFNLIGHLFSKGESLPGSFRQFFGNDQSLITLIFVVLFIVADHLIFRKGFEKWCGRTPMIARWLVYAVLIFSIVVFSGVAVIPFIYQRF